MSVVAVDIIQTMSDIYEARQRILEKITEAKELIPQKELPTLPRSKELLGAPEWYDFELEIWDLGEEIRQIMVQYPKLREDKQLAEQILEIAIDRRAKRGRQSFILLLEYKVYSEYAPRLIAQLDDPAVDGHVISTVLKMRAPQFVDEIEPFTNHKMTWIRNYAKKYVERYS
jgi:hypothetical protein